MPRPRFEKLPPERKASILEAAAREFGEHGFEGASLNQILEVAGVSKGAAYYYFDDKADLFVTVARDLFERSIADIGPAPEHLTPEEFWAGAESIYHRMFAELESRPWFSGMAKAIWRLPKGEREHGALGELFAWARKWVEGLIAMGQGTGAIRRDVPMEILVNLFFAFDEVMDSWLGENLERVGPAQAEALMLRVLRGLRRMVEPAGAGP